MKKTFLFLVLAYACTSSSQPCADFSKFKKTAIVIGNSKYNDHPTLNNPENDAIDMRDSLKRLGFDPVAKFIDADLETMVGGIDDWLNKIDTFDVALFYFAGHGSYANGQNFLYATNSNPTRQFDLQFRTYQLNNLMASLSGSKAKIKIVIIDACRNNPFIRSWTRDAEGKQGLVTASAQGTIVCFAAGENEVAEDGAGRNGTYTAAILKHIGTANQNIYEFITKVNNEVKAVTRNTQNPYITSNLSNSFCFNSTSTVVASGNESSMGNTLGTMLKRVNLNSSLGDVLNFEFGAGSSNLFTYESLPVATECKNATIKYYWRHLKESKLKSRVMSFLHQSGLGEDITDDAYVVYIFKDNQLARIDLKLYSGNDNFYNDLMFALSREQNFAPPRYKVKVGDALYFFTSNKEAGWNTVGISYTNTANLNACDNDWWAK